MVTQLSLFDGDARKKMGQESVLEHNPNWKDGVMNYIESMPKGIKFNSDDIRDMIENLGIGYPSHNNVWGAVFSACAKAKMIRKTGSYVKSDRPEAHARVLAEWVKI